MADETHSGVLDALAAALEQDERIGVHQYPINARIEDEALVLEGTLGDIAAKRIAGRIAHHVAGTIPIIDRLRISATDAGDDGALRDEVINMFTKEPAFSEYTVRVARDGGFETVHQADNDENRVIEARIADSSVTLEGRVGSLTHRRLAEVLIWWTAGCEIVRNHLKVVPAEEENDGELSDAIRIVLEKDPFVHADQLSINTHDSKVTLNGYVASSEEKHLALMDIWYSPGVHEVVDRVEARS